MSIGFIGLGMMGDPMARNLLKAGHQLSVYDIKPEAVEKCVALGAVQADSIVDLASCRIVFIMVNSGEQVSDVLFGDSGLLNDRKKNHKQTIVVMSTISPTLIREFDRQINNKNITLIDIPVSGGPIVAEMAQLSFMAGGDEKKIKEVKPYLEAMGKEIFALGTLGVGLAVKLINNIVALNNAYVFTEALAIGVEANLDPNLIVDVMSASSGKNWCTDNWDIYKAFMGVVLSEPSFQLTAEKDIETAIEWSKDLKLDIPALNHVLSIIKISKGIPDKLKELISVQ